MIVRGAGGGGGLGERGAEGGGGVARGGIAVEGLPFHG